MTSFRTVRAHSRGRQLLDCRFDSAIAGATFGNCPKHRVVHPYVIETTHVRFWRLCCQSGTGVRKRYESIDGSVVQ